MRSTTFYDQIWKKITRRRSKWHGKSLRVSEIVCFVQICCEQVYSSPLSLSGPFEAVQPGTCSTMETMMALHALGSHHLSIKFGYPTISKDQILTWPSWPPFGMTDPMIHDASWRIEDLIPGFGFYLWGKSVFGWLTSLLIIKFHLLCGWVVEMWSRCGLDVPRCYFLEDLDDAGQNEMLQPHLLSEPPGP